MSKKTAALEAAMLEYGRYIKNGEGSTKAVERAIEIYNYVNDSTLQATVVPAVKSPDIQQIRSDVYDELFEMLRLPYTTAESVNDRAKRTTEHVIKHCQVAATRQLLHTATQAMGIYGNRIDKAIAYLHGLSVFSDAVKSAELKEAIEILEGKV